MRGEKLALISVRVPDELKRMMDQFPDLNWSEIIRQSIEARVTLELARRRIKNRARMLEAMTRQDELAERLASKFKGTWSGVEVIRYWREHRYSSSTHR
ncbi:MAG: hypothetical protein AOA65_0042 [Candidatus Bathyarchaeota archaeon BA1]|nr:MAG: hypothetical protein AOA65_0042 [Candidatus Bathyarchaeota archaeon BA1]